VTQKSDSTQQTQQRWAVVGGGILGLATAWKLAERGEKVTVLEAAPELGGLTSAWTLGDTSWDRFYHVTLLSDTRLRALLEEIGLEKEIRWVQIRTGFFQRRKTLFAQQFLRFSQVPAAFSVAEVPARQHDILRFETP